VFGYHPEYKQQVGREANASPRGGQKGLALRNEKARIHGDRRHISHITNYGPNLILCGVGGGEENPKTGKCRSARQLLYTTASGWTFCLVPIHESIHLLIKSLVLILIGSHHCQQLYNPTIPLLQVQEMSFSDPLATPRDRTPHRVDGHQLASPRIFYDHCSIMSSSRLTPVSYDGHMFTVL